MLPEGKCRYIDGQIYPDGNFYVLDTQHIKHNGSELKSALNSINTDISNKVDKVTGKGLSTEDYTTAEKNKLSGIEANANNYVHPTTSGNKHIPSGGSSGKILGWSADGTAAWVDPTGGGAVDSVTVNGQKYTPDSNGDVDIGTVATTDTNTTYTFSGTSASSSTTNGVITITDSNNNKTYVKPYNIGASAFHNDSYFAPYTHSHSTATTTSSGFMSTIDKKELVELVDGGRKNLAYLPDGSRSSNGYIFDKYVINPLPAGSYTFSFTKTNVSTMTVSLWDLNNNKIAEFSPTTATNFTTTATAYKISIWINRTSGTGTLKNMMICTQTAWNISSAYVPYKFFDYKGTIIQPCNVNTLINAGAYLVKQTGSTNLPWSAGEYVFLSVFQLDPTTDEYLLQIARAMVHPEKYYLRYRVSGTWGSWYGYTGTAS